MEDTLEATSSTILREKYILLIILYNKSFPQMPMLTTRNIPLYCENAHHTSTTTET